MIQPKFVQFILLDSVKQRDENGIVMEVQNLRHQISARYSTRNEKGQEVKKVISTGMVWDEKQKKDLPIEVDTLIFLQGFMTLTEGRDDHIIEGMRESVNNKSFKGRLDSDRAIWEEVDPEGKMSAEVEAQDLIVEAYLAIAQAEPKEVIEYAKALNLGVGDMKVNQGTANSKAYKSLTTRMKSEAKKDPQAFINNFGSPLRGNLALISDGILHSVITYDHTSNQFAWLQGTNKTPIIQVPEGMKDKNEWFAAWLKENEATQVELRNRVNVASKMKD